MIKVEIPKEGIRLYAMMKVHELKHNIELKTDEQAINYLKSIGIEIINTKDEIIAELKAENDRLKEIKDDFFNQAEISHQAVLDKNKIIENLEKALQEIKAIVCGNYEIIDPQGRKDILKLITKAEEE